MICFLSLDDSRLDERRLSHQFEFYYYVNVYNTVLGT